jgi:hypothetical protein
MIILFSVLNTVTRMSLNGLSPMKSVDPFSFGVTNPIKKTGPDRIPSASSQISHEAMDMNLGNTSVVRILKTSG